MKRRNTMRAVCGGLAIALAIAVGGCATDDGQPTDEQGDGTTVTAQSEDGLYVVMTRPPNVPADYVTTPNGYFHPDCVREVSSDENVREDGWIEKLDHTAVRRVDACTHPRFDVNGALVDENAPRRGVSTEPTINGWVETADTTSLGPVSYIHAQWNIPPAPASHVGQTIYFFPGLENATNVKSILQPVLAWDQGGSGFSGWSLASWNCCVSGTTYHSGFIAAPGTTVSGDIGGSGCNAAGVCSSWQIVSYDWSSEQSTTLNTTAYGVSMNWVFGGTLEVYGVSACNQLPTGSVEFSAFYIDKAPSGAHVATPAWTNSVDGGTPSCGYSISQDSSHDATLHY